MVRDPKIARKLLFAKKSKIDYCFDIFFSIGSRVLKTQKVTLPSKSAPVSGVVHLDAVREHACTWQTSLVCAEMEMPYGEDDAERDDEVETSGCPVIPLIEAAAVDAVVLSS